MALTWHILTGRDAAQAWERAASACPYATFFETRAWAEVFQAAFPAWKPAPLAVEYSDGNVVVLPAMQRRAFGGLVCYREGMPPGEYGGPLFLYPPGEGHWGAVWEAIGRTNNAVRHTNPFLPGAAQPPITCRRLVTHAIDVSAGIDAVQKGFRRNHRQNIRHAEKEGITVRLATSRGDVDAFCDVYQNSLRRWGRQAGGFYPRRLFHTLFARLEYGEKIALRVAELDGRVVSGALLFYHNQHVVDWHMATLADYLPRHPAPLIVRTAIEDACALGMRWFDFNPSGGLKGVEHFKMGFGAQPLKLLSFRKLRLGGRAFRGYRHFRQGCLHQAGL